jgi:PAS domain S-box-containing protein
MNDQKKTSEQLIAENEELRQRISALQSSEAKWRSIAENAPLFVAVVGQSGTMQFLNRFRPGYEPANVIGKDFCDFLQPEYHAVARACLARVFDTGENTSYESVGAGPEGSLSEYVTDVGPVIVDGQIIAATLISRDITERKRADEALREREARLLEAQEVASLGFYVLDIPQGRWTSSEVLDRIFGIPAEYVRTVNGWTDLLHPDERQWMLDYLLTEVVGNKRPFDREYRIVRHRDKQVRWVHGLGRLQLDEDGQPVFMLGTIQDITERKQAAEKLRNSERTLRTLVNASPESILLMDTAGTILLANDTFAQRLGKSVDEITGAILYDLLPFEVAVNRKKHVEEVARTGKATRFEDRRFGRDVENAVHPILDKQGNVVALAVLGIDQTDRKRAEEALQKAHDELEEKVKERTAELAIFHKFAEASGRGFGMADLEGNITYVNPTLCRLIGEEKPEDVLGKPVSTYYSEENRQKRKTEILPAVFREGSWQGEQALLSRKGTVIPIYECTFLIRKEDGEPLCLAVVIADISDLKRAEEALRASNERYELAVRGVGVGIWDYDIRTGKVYFSPRWKSLFGYDENDIGDSLEDWARLLHPDERGRILKFQEDFLAGTSPTVSVEYRLRHKDGSYRWIIAHGLAVRDEQGRAYRFVGSHGDITDRKQAQEALRESEQRLNFHTEHSPLGVIEWGADFRLSRWTGDAERIFGWQAEEVLGKRLDEFRWVYEKDAERVAQVAAGLRDGTCTRVVSHNRNYRKDGSVIHCEWYNSSLLDTSGKMLSILSLVLDVTERKQAQEALERERQSLWRMLQASDHERQTISYEIHDGLAQYLAAAAMQFQVFTGLRDSNPEEAKKAYDAATQLVRQSHFEARRLISEVRPPVIDENGIEMAISHLVHEQRRHGGPKIDCHSSVQFGRLPAILENALYRIAQEALNNACQHSKSKKVTITLTQEGQEVRLEVRDWGIGFAPNSVEEGHFGLEGIRQRVRLLGGRLTIESKPGSGTLIQAAVPIVERQSEE